MKKLLLAALVVGAQSVNAQSSLTIFGVMDAGVSFGSGTGTGSGSRTQITNSAGLSSRLGFRGIEDLGGGMAASFWLEAGLNNDNGSGQATNTNNQVTGIGPTCAVTTATTTTTTTTPATAGTSVTSTSTSTSACTAAIKGAQGLTFNRRSTVSLSGRWGEVRIGRDYTPAFLNLPGFDPFTVNGVGTAQNFIGAVAPGAPYSATGPTGVVARASNGVAYHLPNTLGGVYGQVAYWFGENASNVEAKKDGTGRGLRIGYAGHGFNVAFGTNRTSYLTGDITSSNLGASYDFGAGRVMAQANRDKTSTATADGKGALVGLVWRLRTGEIRTSWSTYQLNSTANPKVSKFAFGYVHDLSKRTALYVTGARLRNSGGSAQSLAGAVTSANGRSNAFDLGLRHTF